MLKLELIYYVPIFNHLCDVIIIGICVFYSRAAARCLPSRHENIWTKYSK